MIRPFQTQDWPHIWPIIQAVCQAGETYAYAHDMDEETAYQTWVNTPQETWVALNQHQEIVATYYLKSNAAGPGSHVANCGYMVAAPYSGQGWATRLCLHSQERAKVLGFRAMQFNLVVATNLRAVSLWQHLGFAIVGTLPEAYHHRHQGFVNAYVMYKSLVANPDTLG